MQPRFKKFARAKSHSGLRTSVAGLPIRVAPARRGLRGRAGRRRPRWPSGALSSHGSQMHWSYAILTLTFRRADSYMYVTE